VFTGALFCWNSFRRHGNVAKRSLLLVAARNNSASASCVNEARPGGYAVSLRPANATRAKEPMAKSSRLEGSGVEMEEFTHVPSV
jgi:hypothetical protein